MGFAKVDITPEQDVGLWGYGFYLERRARKFMTPLYCRALVFEFQKKKFAVVSLDIGAIERNLAGKIRLLAEKLTGIPQNNILLGATHTHYAPATFLMNGCGDPNEAYISEFTDKAVKSIVLAARKKRGCCVGFGQADGADFMHNRATKEEEIDTALNVVGFFDDESGKLLASIVNMNCHPVNLKKGNAVSGDYPFYLCQALEKCAIPHFPLFLQGASGEINPVTALKGSREAEKMGKVLASRACEVLRKLVPQRVKETSIKNRIVCLPQSRITREQAARIRNEAASVLTRFISGDKSVSLAAKNSAGIRLDWALRLQDENVRVPQNGLNIEMQTIRINDICLISYPGEFFSSILLKLKRKLPHAHIMLAGCANGWFGYLPDEYDFRNKGYASTTVPFFAGMPFFSSNVADYWLGEAETLLKH